MFRLCLCGADVFELANLFKRLSVHLYVGRWFWLDAVDENFAIVGADFHAVFFSRCFIQSLSELLQFFFNASPQRTHN